MLLATVLLALRFTVRDAYHLPAWIYYFFGLAPLIAALYAASGVVALLAQRRRPAVASFAMAAAVFAGWVGSAYHHITCEHRGDAVRVVTWNLSRLRDGADRVVADLQSLDPDIALLVETGHDNREAREFWEKSFADHEIVFAGGGIVVMARGEVGEPESGSLAGISSYATLDVSVRGQAFHVMVVDLDASPRFDKRQLVPEVFRIASETNTNARALIVAGDFNTPIFSPVFIDVRQRFVNAFEAAGSGLHATWPSRFPLTAIDHIWTRKNIEVGCSRLFTSPASDHRAVVADVWPVSR
ncbi:MAG: endonuclease/exonuclease/phosphatase (EEP) superfamily protein YafD [Hyphomicrobiaceae bacterium]|jgi:endonuclease/exonuclease/phosphatase (EEP) superfamily protein YafD